MYVDKLKGKKLEIFEKVCLIIMCFAVIFLGDFAINGNGINTIACMFLIMIVVCVGGIVANDINFSVVVVFLFAIAISILSGIAFIARSLKGLAILGDINVSVVLVFIFATLIFIVLANIKKYNYKRGSALMFATSFAFTGASFILIYIYVNLFISCSDVLMCIIGCGSMIIPFVFIFMCLELYAKKLLKGEK